MTAVALGVVAAASVVAPVSAEGENYVLVSHAPDSDTWWNTIK
ncbi:MAG: sugar ABC transporter substrate-binding protein, partial [Pseudomonadota bacterium]